MLPPPNARPQPFDAFGQGAAIEPQVAAIRYAALVKCPDFSAPRFLPLSSSFVLSRRYRARFV